MAVFSVDLTFGGVLGYQSGEVISVDFLVHFIVALQIACSLNKCTVGQQR